MNDEPSYSNSLFISNYGKAIPYPGGVSKSGKSQKNHGFTNLKAKPQLIDSIPELISDEGLKSLVRSLNLSDGSFFSVGCFSGIFREVKGYKYQGYIEFAFNCQMCVADARNYFSLYFRFEQFLRQQNFQSRVKFNWMLEEARFLDVKIDGFSCAIFINTNYHPSLDKAKKVWQQSLERLESFFSSVRVRPHSTIY